MLIPSGKPIFENVSSRDYYGRIGSFKDKKTDGCIHIIFPDFEEAIIFSEGEPVTGIFESKRWLSVGDELLGPAENKAIAAFGKMSGYELPSGLVHVFVHKNVENMVETELGPYMTAGLLIGYLETGRNTCVLKLEDKRSTGYVFINFGKRVGAVYSTPDGRTYDDKAVKDMERLQEKTSVTIYFMELSDKYLRSRAESRIEEKPAAPIAPPEPAKAFPTEAIKAPAAKAPTPSMPVMKPAIPIEKPVTAARPSKPKAVYQLRLMVVRSEDRSVGIAHRSKQSTLEALEEKDIAWVDKNTLNALRTLRARIVLPGGKEYPVTLKEVSIVPDDSRYIILPRKLRDKLSIGQGTTVEVKA